MSLSEQDRDRIANAVWAAGSRTRSQLLPELLAAVEAIVQRAVNAALNDAADEIDYAANVCREAHTSECIGFNAYQHSFGIVRARRT